jgi:hypothetical protein
MLCVQFNLVCGRQNLVELVSTIYSVGSVTGAFIGGNVSDRLVSAISLEYFTKFTLNRRLLLLN